MTLHTLHNGERQVAPTIDGIRRDHVARYEWARNWLRNEFCRRVHETRIIDFACGVGYGAHLLAKEGFRVFAADKSAEAIAYAKEHYSGSFAWHRLAYNVVDANHLVIGDPAVLLGDPASCGYQLPSADAAVCFETIEHLEDPAPMLKALAAASPILLASVPNESVFPHGGRIAHHFRHYTQEDFFRLLDDCGWEIESWRGQKGPESPVEYNEVNGRTLIAVARRKAKNFFALGRQEAALLEGRAERSAEQEIVTISKERPLAGKHVALVGLGPSAESYMGLVKRLGGRKAFCDETWAINALGDIIACDRIFHMDDVRVQEKRAAANPGGNIAPMVRWLKETRTPVVTSFAHPDYPALEAFPLEAVINDLGYVYFNSTAAYAVAYAIHLGAAKISIFGFDFTYPNAHHAERGRACVEFWLGVAAARGVEIGLADRTSLMDLCDGDQILYGYDGAFVAIETEDGMARVSFNEKEIPSADEIERRYDHSRHPNSVMVTEIRTDTGADADASLTGTEERKL